MKKIPLFLLDLLVQVYLLRLFFVDPSSRLHNIH